MAQQITYGIQRHALLNRAFHDSMRSTVMAVSGSGYQVLKSHIVSQACLQPCADDWTTSINPSCICVGDEHSKSHAVGSLDAVQWVQTVRDISEDLLTSYSSFLWRNRVNLANHDATIAHETCVVRTHATEADRPRSPEQPRLRASVCDCSILASSP
jgi:hypothetical protein